MSNLSRLTPQILDYISPVKGWERKTLLMLLVGSRTAPADDSWTELGISQLMKYDRDRNQARHDHKVLCALADEHRVLSRRTGQGADTWRLAGSGPESLRNWRQVPWSTPVRHVIADLRAHERGAIAVGMTYDAGQSVFSMTHDGAKPEGRDSLTSAFTSPEMSSQPPCMSSQPQSPGETPAKDVIPTAEVPTPLTMPLERDSLSLPRDSGREGGGAPQGSKAAQISTGHDPEATDSR